MTTIFFVTMAIAIAATVVTWAAARMAGIVDAEQAALHSPAAGEGEYMTDKQLQQLAALAEAATPGRWIAERGMGVRLADYTPICMPWSQTSEPINVDANMAFIAAARDAVPELLAEAAALRRQLAECQAWLERISLAAGADDATPAAILSALIEYGGE